MDEPTLARDLPHVPVLPAALIPHVDNIIPRPEGYIPHVLGVEELVSMRADLTWVAKEFGAASPVYSAALMVVALEYARAELIP